MEIGDLARWTPVAVDLSGPEPSVDWADLRATRFQEPFFDQTVARWAAGDGARPLVRTGLDALLALDEKDSLDPCGMIFHLSRCGSTLVSRLLGTVPGVLVVAEPSPLNALLELDPDRVDSGVRVTLVRLLVRALGRRRWGDEKHYILKLSSWNIRRRAVLAAAFPDLPWLWVQRAPTRILASLLAEPPGWLGLQAAPARAARLFGLEAADIPTMSKVEFAARALGAMAAAAGEDARGRLTLDHAEMPKAIWTRAAPHFGLTPDAAAIAAMTDEARYYAKDPSPRAFVGDVEERRPSSEAMRAAAERFVDPAWQALAGLGDSNGSL